MLLQDLATWAALTLAISLGVGAPPAAAQDVGVGADAGVRAIADTGAGVGVRASADAGSAQPAASSAPPPRPTRPPSGNDTRVGIGPRGGITVNWDQWIAGGYGRIDGFCVGACSRNLGIELQLLAGFGGNHMTLRGSLRFEYVIWFVDEMFGIYPILGWSLLGYVPIGKFASFCYRVDLRGCGGWDTGLEVGGGFRVWRFSLGIVAGVGGIPIATIAIGYNFKVWGASQ